MDKRNLPTKALSGGMKRKLSVLLALIGGSKVSHEQNTVIVCHIMELPCHCFLIRFAISTD